MPWHHFRAVMQHYWHVVMCGAPAVFYVAQHTNVMLVVVVPSM